MSIDFESKEGRTNYLNEKLDNLLSGVNTSYGQVLLEELVTRLSRTISDFNEEVNDVLEELKENSSKQAEIMHNLMEGGGGDIPQADSDEADESTEPSDDVAEMSAWEKRLEGK